MRDLLCKAIQTKRVVEFFYKGGTRVVEPYCYGIHKDSDNYVLCAYQLSGYSESGGLPDWRLFIVPKISSFKITNTEFLGSRDDYVANDSRMSRIICNIPQNI